MELEATLEEEGKVQLALYSYAYTGGMPTVVTLKLCAQLAGSQGSYGYQKKSIVRFNGGKGWGWSDFFRKGPISCIDQLSDFIVAGQLRLRLELLNIDGRQLG